jgi:predicted amidohydrolase YtcJ
VSPARPAAELVVTGAPIRTFAAGAARVEAIGIAGGEVVSVGTLAAVESEAAPGARMLRLPAGGAVLPGFCDTHMHFEKIAGELRMVQLGAARSIADVLERVGEAARDAEPGELIQSFGDDNAWHEERLRERRLPTRAELDAVVPDHPVYLYRGGDAAALNSAAAAALGDLLAADPGWDELAGLLRSPRARELQESLQGPADRLGALADASRTLLGLGITTIVDPGLPAGFESAWDLYERGGSSGKIAQRLYLMDRLDHRRPFEAELGRAATGPISRSTAIGDRLHAWGMKALVDGEFANAWMGPGDPQPAPAARRYTGEQIESILRVCAERGWPACFHAMGRGAVEAIVAAVRRVGGGAVFAPGQVTLAHAFLMSEADMDACAELGLAASVQPLLAYVFGREMLAAWGEHAHRANRYRLMLERGMAVAGGSDVLPCEPLRGAAVAVTRTSREGSVLGADQALAPEEALALFTRGAGAYVRRPQLGTLGVGAPADFAVWPVDPVAVPPAEWPELRPLYTAVGGEVVWKGDAAPPLVPSSKGASVV